MQTVQAALEPLAAALDSVTELAPDFVQLLQRARNLLDSLHLFGRSAGEDRVRWLEVGTHLRLVESPLDIADAFGKLLSPTSGAAANPVADDVADGFEAPTPVGQALTQRAWVFTSATLGEDAALRWFTEPCGLAAAEVLRVGSPFDYPSQAAVYVPGDLVRPSDPAHPRQVAELAAQGAARLSGRTLVLTTTLSAMRSIAEQLNQTVGATGQVEVLVQGQWPKRRLMERFRQGNQDGQSGCVLVASASFWEGFDVPGDALQLVVIDKLPFPPPNDPLVEARSQRLSEQGRSPFADHALPEAVIALKQGAGRLIRSETDRGVLVICDTRMRTMGYGKRLRQALPPMRWLDSREDYLQVLEEITTASTRDPNAFAPSR
jgi:ATP-dependent DNA helicase DinG